MSSTKRFIAAAVPKPSELKFFTAQIQPSENKDLSAQTDYQWQIIKARFLIWKYANLLAAPVIGRPDSIYIIVPNIDAENGTLVEFAKDSNIKIRGPSHLTYDIYQLCITYSFGFRLAPAWNEIGKVWIQSLDFLTSVETLPAVEWQPNVAGAILRANIQATRARLSFLDLHEYGIDFETLKRTGQHPISGTAYVLPKQKLCHLVNLSVFIPRGCPFTTYDLLRKHWKNAYGLRLPRDGSSMLYVQVRFGWKNDLYSYPILCVRPCKLRKLPSRDVDGTITAFVDTIVEKCKTVCGMPIEFKIFESDSPSILASSKVEMPLKEVNLGRSQATSLLSQSMPLIPTKRQAPLGAISQNFSPDDAESNMEKLLPFESQVMVDADPESVLRNKLLNEMMPNKTDVGTEKEVKTKFVPSFSKQRSILTVTKAKPGDSDNKNGNKKFVPVFKVPKPIKKLSTEVKLNETVPIDCPVLPSAASQIPRPIPTPTVVNYSNVATSQPVFPAFKPITPQSETTTESQTSNVTQIPQISSVAENNGVLPSFSQIYRPNFSTDVSQLDTVKTPPVVPTSKHKIWEPVNLTHTAAKSNVVLPSFSQTYRPNFPANFTHSQTVFTQPVFPTAEPGMTALTGNERDGLTQILQVPTVPNIASVVPKPAKAKRPNPPPADITALAKSQNLQKATIPSLKEFCKDRKIGRYSKAKKEGLMEMVYKYFGLSMPASEVKKSPSTSNNVAIVKQTVSVTEQNSAQALNIDVKPEPTE